MKIRVYDDAKDRQRVIALWEQIFTADAPHRKPETSIDNKLALGDEMFLVAEEYSQLLGTVMYGYDGHRGWIYALAVDPQQRGKSIGSSLLKKAEDHLRQLGCLKINLQILESNLGVIDFYKKQGFYVDPVVSMGKKLY